MVVWTVSTTSKRGDGSLSVLFAGDGGEGHRVEGAPDIPETDLIIWFEAMLAEQAILSAQEEAERLAREALLNA